MSHLRKNVHFRDLYPKVFEILNKENLKLDDRITKHNYFELDQFFQLDEYE